jgi:pimeloyl-ACP methyl ester carboxylesterase
MAKRPPEVASLFTTQYEPQDLMWLPIFFAPSKSSQDAGKEWLRRIRERKEQRDTIVSAETAVAHRKAAGAWGQPAPNSYAYLKAITQPALVVNGSSDVVVPTVNSYLLQQNMPDARLILYPNAGHGAQFQYHESFVTQVNLFLQ